ncbi:plasmalemma vesicle associated protein b [Lepisosteus oculatus]|uniref:Plasmalemma vesicle associated protein b n=1 Tax=Lepisosteus oculatus TaxID=7918 RepID=W5M5F3_LEPOC|nr:PREDICTED: plasmalemma vesicle-associated protein [Lepisosteus oculatus]
MYDSSYSRAKFGLEAKDIHKAKSRSCSYYMKIILFFSSLVQSLIIVGLVLFMVYGKPHKTAEELRVEDLEHNLERLSVDNLAQKKRSHNLTLQLNVSMTNNNHKELELRRARYIANNSAISIKTLNQRLTACEAQRKLDTQSISTARCQPQTPSLGRPYDAEKYALTRERDYLKNTLDVVKTNFTISMQAVKNDLDSTKKEKDLLRQETINLRREKTDMQKELEMFKKKCKEDFVQSLTGIREVTNTFLQKINSLNPQALSFALTCDKQQEQLNRIRSNCSGLSRDIENKFQAYLDRVGEDVSRIQSESSRLTAENARLRSDFGECSANRSALLLEHGRRVQELQARHDNEVERMLKEQARLRGERELQGQTLKLKDLEIARLNNKVQSLNVSLAGCIPRPQPVPPYPGYKLPDNSYQKFQVDLQKNLQELQQFADKGSSVSG